MDKMKMLSSEDAILAIDEISDVNPESIRNFPSYFIGILNRHTRGESSRQKKKDKVGSHRDDRERERSRSRRDVSFRTRNFFGAGSCLTQFFCNCRRIVMKDPEMKETKDGALEKEAIVVRLTDVIVVVVTRAKEVGLIQEINTIVTVVMKSMNGENVGADVGIEVVRDHALDLGQGQDQEVDMTEKEMTIMMNGVTAEVVMKNMESADQVLVEVMNVTSGGTVTKKTLIDVVHIEMDHLTLAGRKACLECLDTIMVLPWVCLMATLFLHRRCNRRQICTFRQLHHLVM